MICSTVPGTGRGGMWCAPAAAACCGMKTAAQFILSAAFGTTDWQTVWTLSPAFKISMAYGLLYSCNNIAIYDNDKKSRKAS